MTRPPAPTQVAAANAAAASFAGLTAKINYLSSEDVNRVRTAYRFADAAHLGQMRKDGLPYITHPIAVAVQCTEWKLDAPAIMAALLHDVMEDCGVAKLDLIEQFGAQVADLVDGLTKLDKVQFNSREENQSESFRKMLLAMARDVRVILIKLADRTHNMRTMGEMARPAQRRISRETLDIYAPIAHRLGLNQTYRELQDLAFKHCYPWRYAILSKAITRARSRRRDLLQKVLQQVEQELAKVPIKSHMAGREKTLYSIYLKMRRKRLSFAQVTDLYGFRVIVPTVTDCYTALGVLHQLYKPVPGKFKDHIAIAKSNGYQSLHTTLVGPSSINIEFQMRTEPMHWVADTGVAAHWLYKSTPQSGTAQERLGSFDNQWLKSLLDIQDETRDAAEFFDHVKVDLFPEAIYVFTPKGQIMSLPRGATVLDFAYAIHSNVGEHAVSGRIGDGAVALRTELKNGDVIKITTDPTAHPDPAWLRFARSARARSKIRQYLKTMAQTESQALGEKLLTQAIRAEGIEKLPERDAAMHVLWDKVFRFTGNRSFNDLVIDIGLGKRIASLVARRIVSLLGETGQKPDAVLMTRERYGNEENIGMSAVTLDGSESASVQYANCCKPVPGEAILGYLGHGEGLVVHVADCAVAKRLQQKDAERFIEVDWADETVRQFEVRLLVTVTDGQGVLARITTAIATAGADIAHFDMGAESAKDATDLRFTLNIDDVQHLTSITHILERTTAVLRVQRMGASAD